MRRCRRGHALIWASTEKCCEGVTDFTCQDGLLGASASIYDARRFRHRRSLDVVARASLVYLLSL